MAACSFRSARLAMEAKYNTAAIALESQITHDMVMGEARVIIDELVEAKKPCLCHPTAFPMEGNGFCGAVRSEARNRIRAALLKKNPLPDINAETAAEWAKIRLTFKDKKTLRIQ